MKRSLPLARLALLATLLLSACSQAPSTPPAATEVAAVSQPTATAGLNQSPPAQPTSLAEPAPDSPRFNCLKGRMLQVEPAAIVAAGPSTGMEPSPAKGQALIVEGAVFADDCSPLAGARVNFHHTDADGNYGPPSASTSELECCYYQGQVAADQNGRFNIETIRPGAYQGQNPPPMAHIHLEITHPDAKTLHTEIVFADDPQLIPGAAEPDLEVVQPVEMITKDGSSWAAPAEFILQRTTAAKLTPPSAPAGLDSATGARSFRIQPGESRAFYIIREKFADLVDLTVAEATTPGVEGDLRLQLYGPPLLESMTVRVDLRQLKSDEPNRDNKLPEQWLETDRYPYAEFSAENVQLSSSDYTPGRELSFPLPGQLTIHGQTRPVEFQVTAHLDGDGISGSAETTLLMSDFGIDPPDLLGFVTVEDEVRVRVELRANMTGAVSETKGQPGSIKPAACAVTQPNGSLPPGETKPSENHHGNGQLWTVLPPNGVTAIVPDHDGRLAMKFPWWRGVTGALTISGRRLDGGLQGEAPPLSADIPDGYGESGFQASAIIFPSPGCWEVTGRAGEATLTFVTRVVVAD